MTTPIRFLLCALAVAVPAVLALQAGDARSARTTGRVLVLDNDRILEGDIEREGDQYRIRRSAGEIWIPGDKVLCLCADVEEAYAFLGSRANLGDPDERLRLARWCQVHGLRAQALAEVSAAVELRPSHEESRRLLRNLQRSIATAASVQAPRTTEGSSSAPTPANAIDFNLEALGLFTTRVQPILMNTCASCHATGRGGSFKLTRVSGDGNMHRRAMLQNLAAVLAQVNRERPQASPLLTMAVTVHGDTDQPPLKSSQITAYRTLEEWVHLAIRNHGSGIGNQGPGIRSQESGVRNQESDGRNPASPVPSRPVDPFDPAIFNRQAHPDQKMENRKQATPDP